MKIRRNIFLALLALLMLSAAPLAWSHSSSQSAETLPAWEQLTPAQREQLIAPLREHWNTQPQSRARMLHHAQRWQQLDPKQRTRARHGMHRLETMSPEQRTQARAMYEHMRNLPEAERRALRERWKKMTPEERKTWMQKNHPQTP